MGERDICFSGLFVRGVVVVEGTGLFGVWGFEFFSVVRYLLLFYFDLFG